MKRALVLVANTLGIQLKRNLFTLQLLRRHLLFWAGAVMIGVVAVSFAKLGAMAINIFRMGINQWEYFAFIVMALGFCILVWVQRRFFPGAQGSGIPQAIAALHVTGHQKRSCLISLRIAFGKFFLTAGSLLCGASVGREGPTAQIAASMMYSLSRWTIFPKHYIKRGLIIAGGSAGIAAAFNTPMAGILFAIEELSRSFEHELSGTILTSVVIAGITSVAFLGNYTYFGQSTAVLELGREWLAVVVCGVAGGVIGGTFSCLLIVWTRKMKNFARRYPYLLAFSCGLILAAIGLYSGHLTYGTGYQQAKWILQDKPGMPDAFGILKIISIFVSYMSGIAGGIFAPTLSAGAGLGQMLSHVLNFVDVDTSAVVVLAMVAYFCGVVQSPITCFVIVSEMIDQHDMVLSVLAASVIAWAASRVVCPKPLYHTLAEGFIKEAKLSG